MKRLTTQPRPLHVAARQRSGSALIVVLIVVALLSLGAYSYSEFMLTEYRAADAYGRQAQSAAWAQSGVEHVAALLTSAGGGWDADLYENPSLFHVMLEPQGGFTIVAPVTDGAVSVQGSVVRQGLIDECSKLNVNVLAAFDPTDNVGRNMLMALPNMTEEIADAILDWIDADEDQRTYGAESTSYDLVLPRNGAIDTLEELLLVHGVTPELLYGEDANRNGLLDANENDGELTPPFDNADGVLNLGWAEYLTTYSLESNLRHASDRFGEERLHVNEPLLAELYDTLSEELGDDAALFITAFRMNGPVSTGEDAAAVGANPLNGVAVGGTGQVSTGDAQTDAAMQQLASNLARNAFSGEGSVTRGGLDLTAGAKVEIKSLFELIDAEVEVEIDGQMTTLVSPWSSSGSLQQDLPLLLDALTVTTNPTIAGRININQARREVLLAVPGMPADVPEKIIAARAGMGAGGSSQFQTTGWLVMQNLVDLPTMRQLDGFLTARGEVYRLQVIGHADRGGPMTRIEAVVDASETVPRIVWQRDLGELGPGFRRGDLPLFGN